MVVRLYSLEVRFRKRFGEMVLPRQTGIDRYARSRLFEAFRDECSRTGMTNTSLHHTNTWYVDLRNNAGPKWLRQSTSGMTRQAPYGLGTYYEQYIEEQLKAAGIKPETEYGELHFKRYSGHISILLTITHDNTTGSARFTGEHTIRISKMGYIKLFRPFPTPNYRPRSARLYQTRDGKWRIAIMCGVSDPEPHVGDPVLVGVVRRVGSVATAGHTIEPLPKMVCRMQDAGRSVNRAQCITLRRQKPDGRNRKSGSRCRAKAQKCVAKKHHAASIRHTIVDQASCVMADSATHAAVESLNTEGMTKPAKGTAEKPDRSVAQKSDLNKSMLAQYWGTFIGLLAYKHAGSVIYAVAAYTSQRCSVCGFTDTCNRSGRGFLCLLYQYKMHTDQNATKDTKNDGARKLGRPVRYDSLAPPRRTCPMTHARSARAKRRPGVEGFNVGSPPKRQIPNGVRPSVAVVFWGDIQCMQTVASTWFVIEPCFADLTGMTASAQTAYGITRGWAEQPNRQDGAASGAAGLRRDRS